MGHLDIPLDCIHTHGRNRFNDVVVVLAERRSEQDGHDARDGGDLVVARCDVFKDLFCGHLGKVFVVVRVVHDLVSGVRELLDGFGIFVDPHPHDEKRRLDIVPAEYIDELLRILVAPRRVECQRYGLVVAFDAVDRQRAFRCRRFDDRWVVDSDKYKNDHQYRRAERDSFSCKHKELMPFAVVYISHGHPSKSYILENMTKVRALFPYRHNRFLRSLKEDTLIIIDSDREHHQPWLRSEIIITGFMDTGNLKNLKNTADLTNRYRAAFFLRDSAI